MHRLIHLYTHRQAFSLPVIQIVYETIRDSTSSKKGPNSAREFRLVCVRMQH